MITLNPDKLTVKVNGHRCLERTSCYLVPRGTKGQLQIPKGSALGEESIDPSTPEATMVAEARLF